MFNKDYFQNAMNNVNERFSSADGFADDNGGFAMDGGGELYATGQAPAPAAAAPTSQPYIINIANTTGGALTATIYGAYSQLFGQTNYGNATGINVTSGITNITYGEILGQSMSKPFECGLIYLQSTNTSQITQALTITHKDANGMQMTMPVIPTKDPYQNLDTVLAVRYRFKMDGFASIAVSILAGATLTMQIYPSEIADAGRIITTGSATRTFGSPRIGLAVGSQRNLIG